MRFEIICRKLNNPLGSVEVLSLEEFDIVFDQDGLPTGI